MDSSVRLEYSILTILLLSFSRRAGGRLLCTVVISDDAQGLHSVVTLEGFVLLAESLPTDIDTDQRNHSMRTHACGI